MKKIFLALLCIVLSIGTFAGCSKKEETAAADERTVVLDEVGLTYRVPDAWAEYEEANIVPLTLTGHYTFAEILYLYVTPEDLQRVNDGDATFLTVGEPLFEIAVAKAEEFEDDEEHKAIFAYFNDYDTVGKQGDYTYYLFYNSKYAERNLDEEHLEVYQKLSENIPELKESIETRDFDPTPIAEYISFTNDYLTFETQNLANEAPVMSTIFSYYDLSLVNFSATSAYPSANEFEVLHSVNHLLTGAQNGKFSVIQVLLDSYDDNAVKTAIAEKTKAEADFITLKTDQLLSNWAMKNLSDLPATVFVDTNGKIVGEPIIGALTYEEYAEAFLDRFELMESGNY